MMKTMKDSNKYTNKQYDYIMQLAKKAYPLQGWKVENEHVVDEKHLKAVESFAQDVKNEVLRLVKKNLEENPTKKMASMIIDMLQEHKNGFLPEVAPKNFAEIVDKNNQNDTFNEQVEPWYQTGWEEHSKTI